MAKRSIVRTNILSIPRLAALLIPAILALPVPAWAQQIAYIASNTPLLQIENKTQQAEAWAVCAAVYDLMLDSLEQRNPGNAAMAKEMRDSAALAVDMSLLMRDHSTDLSFSEFKQAFAEVREEGKRIRIIKHQLVYKDFSAAATGSTPAYTQKIEATLTLCKENQEGQAFYQDLWQFFIGKSRQKSGQFE